MSDETIQKPFEIGEEDTHLIQIKKKTKTIKFYSIPKWVALPAPLKFVKNHRKFIKQHFMVFDRYKDLNP